MRSRRARDHSPFLREALRRAPEIAEAFLDARRSGRGRARAGAARDDDLEARSAPAAPRPRARRRARRSCRRAAARAGDAAALRFRRPGDRRGGRRRDRASGCPTPSRSGFAVIAMGKLGSRELNYSSDVDLLLLFDPATLPRRERDDAGEAAVRIGRRLIEMLQKRTEDGYVERVDLRLRPSPEVTPIALPVDAAISHYESSALPWERAAFIRARAAAGDIALGQRFLDAIQPFVWRRSLDFGVIEEVRQISARIRDHFAQGATIGPGLRPQARARRHPRGRVLRPDPADDPRRPRSVGARPGDPRRDRGAGRRRPARRRDGADELARRLSPAAHRSSIACRWSTTRRPICFPPSPPRSTMSRGCTACGTAQELLDDAPARTSSASGAIFDSLVAGRAERAVQRPRHPQARARGAGLRRCRGCRAPRRRLALGQGALASLAGGAAGVRGDASGAAPGDRRGRRSRSRAQPSRRHRRAAVERRELLPPARGAAGARASCSRRSWPTRPRSPTSSARRPELFEGLVRRVELRDAARRRTSSRACLRARCAGSPMTSRSTARGGWSTSAASRSASS